MDEGTVVGCPAVKVDISGTRRGLATPGQTRGIVGDEFKADQHVVVTIVDDVKPSNDHSIHT